MSRRVLVIEDVASQLHCYERVLKRAGFVVKGCDSAQCGYLELTQGGPYDLVLIDEHLPDLVGTKLLPLVQGVLEDETPPFVLMTGAEGSTIGKDGLARPAEYEEYRESGFSDALAKPLNPRQLATVLDAVMAGRHQTDAVDASTGWIEAAQAWANLGGDP